MTDHNNLRKKAENLVLEKAPLKDTGTLSPDGLRQMLHELQVHQIELQMQNEELQSAEREVCVAVKRYSDFYDLAPKKG
jgi:hypothetical protein